MSEIEVLVKELEKYNQAYRGGAPLVGDAQYDQLVEQLRVLDPAHPFLGAVESERFAGKIEVRHPTPMLSLEKAYTRDQLERFISRMEKEALSLGIADLQYQVSPKLDGLAGRDDGIVFASRGNGLVGYEISSAFDKGVVPIGGRGQGLGEIVVVKSYFNRQLADKFEHPRNMVVGIVSSDTLNIDARQALSDQMVHFVPYRQLGKWQGFAVSLLDEIERIVEDLATETDYPMDGVVVEVLNDDLRAKLGATSHHHRWQIAVKRKGETVTTNVVSIQWQVGRTGNVTPVLEVSPVSLSGATIRRVTAHHAGLIAKNKIGPGALIEIIRSGEVIPKLEKVHAPSQVVDIPERCPACCQPLILNGDFLRCENRSCAAQIEQRIIHWFKTLGNADWFGVKTIEKLTSGGFNTLEKIYGMTIDDFSVLGFGPVQSLNLFQALETSRTKQVEDWRFLAALGISNLGVGDSRRLLQHIALETLLGAEPRAIAAISGFGEKTSQAICEGITEIRQTITYLLSLGFNLARTSPENEALAKQSPISGKKVVFTGKMTGASREQMQTQARQLGAIVQSVVGKTTDMLVCGDQVGQKKRDSATRFKVRILTQEAYLDLIKER